MEITYRPRRLRRSPALRAMVRENQLLPADFIYPLFVHEGAEVEPIGAMPGANRWSLDRLSAEVQRAWDLGIRCVVLFPKVSEGLKTEDGSESFNANGLIPRAIRQLKREVPDMAIMTDVALDPYSCDGHDGIVSPEGVVLNDETIDQLCKQAVMQAEAGADLIGPSDMMDGRVGAIREALDDAGFEHVGIISYTAKYSSAYYGPFREALDSAPRATTEKVIPKNKDTYQMDPANAREAITEAQLDEQEGADIMMVKPGLAYLDIICRLRDESELPIAAYNVSGEYSMVKAAAERGWIDERAVVLETLLSFKRAGADLILTYHACDAAEWLQMR
ncbi:MAG: porphobilinogen synthase [Synechococcus sp. TMED66]|jgi:porphobilinogen synthase|uniref:porphobilinogen synthase n=1 Tax=Synechococcus sp. PROS-9-1 TaxID=1968775 RepID=UPI000B684D73|nr:porphobilinogen synthase [Synechococcus sp. PROS-9-1]MBC8168330.1 porphobilinogen synthase [Synechococcus sp.]MBL6887995.1 porphobilinogen synthase [Synechococcus sp. BS30m-G30]RCL56711.1 MAG: porphobilinogen synthase [Synechococcus sp. MED-G68]RPF74553.1 MAG: porphobilinogen synthase [Synechococcus sp. TMED66]QNJ32671.1 delta-aminolevulinic acid dehydratase [Synechococcus sp. PROS-9-1]|tara:strand:+ start:234 stop:1235 length:1002 start_codon:yes stop_codon:yes gene_type:complete